MPDELIARLARLDVCAVSDAIDSLGYGGGATGGAHRLWKCPTLCGRAVPMAVVEAPGVSADRHLGVGAIERSHPGDVIVIAAQPSLPSACWGGLLARAAVARRVAGVVMNGPCRDLDEIEDLGLPVFATGVVPNTARRRVVEETCGEPIMFAGIAVASGDLVLADGSGVAVVTAAAAGDVLMAAERLVRREQAMAAAIDDGDALTTVLGRDYEEMLDAKQ